MSIFDRILRRTSKPKERQAPTSSIDSFINSALQDQPADCHVRITQYQNVYHALGWAFRNKGHSARETVDLLHANLTVSCPKCGAQMNVEYLTLLLFITSPSVEAYCGPKAARAARFSRGRCLDERCSSTEIVLSWRHK